MHRDFTSGKYICFFRHSTRRPIEA